MEGEGRVEGWLVEGVNKTDRPCLQATNFQLSGEAKTLLGFIHPESACFYQGSDLVARMITNRLFLYDICIIPVFWMLRVICIKFECAM